MDRASLAQLLEDVRAGRIDVEAAAARLAALPYEDLGFAKVDHHRALRAGGPEAVFCPGKTPEQVVAIVGRLAAHHANVVATRCDAVTAAAVEASGLACAYHPLPRLLVVRPEPAEGTGLLAV